MKTLIPWKVGVWIVAGSVALMAAVYFQNPLPVIGLVGLSFPAERWLVTK